MSLDNYDPYEVKTEWCTHSRDVVAVINHLTITSRKEGWMLEVVEYAETTEDDKGYVSYVKHMN